MSKKLFIFAVCSVVCFIATIQFISRTENKKVSNHKKTAPVETVFFDEKKDSNETMEIKKDQPEKPIELFFAGDAMLDRNIRALTKSKGVDFLTEKMQRAFLGPDEIIFNLEGTVTKNNSVSVGTMPGEKNHTKFTFDEMTTKNFLQNIHAKTVFIGNNHIWDFEEMGFQETKNFLQENLVEYFGAVKSKNESVIKTIKGKKVAFIAFNQFLGGPAKNTVAEIERVQKEADFVVVYAHWGTEYDRIENVKQKEWAHSFIDAGANLIIGSHPHVVQPLEIYKNKAIFYSLGNFIFDQYFSSDTMEGLTVGVSLQDDVIDFALSPININRDSSVSLSEGKKKYNMLLWLSEKSVVSDEVRNNLKLGNFQIKLK